MQELKYTPVFFNKEIKKYDKFNIYNVKSLIYMG